MTTNIGHDDYMRVKLANEAALSGPAFPVNEHDSVGNHHQTHLGMTMRDYFAAKAMQAFIGEHVDACGDDHLAECSYQVADAMLKARGEA